MSDDVNDLDDREGLESLYRRRADRAQPPAEPADVLEAVRAGAKRRERVKRNRLAVGSGALIVVAASALTLVFVSGNGDSRPAAAGGRPAATGPTISASIATTSSADARLRAKQALARERAGATLTRRQELLQAKKALLRARARQAKEEHNKTVLMPVDPAPDQAELSIGLVPKGFRYLSHDSANTYYGLPGTADQPDFQREIVVDVHLTGPDGGSFPITIGGKPGSYAHGGGYTVVRVKYDERVDVGFQVPPNVTLTKAQALKIASTIDVRSTKHTTKG